MSSPTPHLPPILPNPHLTHQIRQGTHTQAISAPDYPLFAPPSYSAGPTRISPRPELRVITSFPTPPPRRVKPRFTHQSLGGPPLIQPVPLRPHALDPICTAPLPSNGGSSVRRKPVPDLHVHVEQTAVCPPPRPDAPMRSSLEKRRNREAVIISQEIYTSYQPDRVDWDLSDSAGDRREEGIRDISPAQIIPPSSRPSVRGHKRTISDKFKSLFSPSPPKLPHLRLGTSSSASEMPEELFERIPIYDDDADIPTYSATYPQPDDPFHLCPPRMDEEGGQPGRPYRSPGTASFVVSREVEIWRGSEIQEGRNENTSRRDTFGVIIKEELMTGGDLEEKKILSALNTDRLEGMTSPGGGGHEADDEMSAVSDGGGDIVEAFLGRREGLVRG